ncbi:hypothetical protein [Lentzea sp. NPDC059081]|uniref:DUF7507 domain-containing protein n=1 Tax=Lentzea sp. NPDC059081 TaxID=3346719 RepID=UPI0036B7FB7A
MGEYRRTRIVYARPRTRTSRRFTGAVAALVVAAGGIAALSPGDRPVTREIAPVADTGATFSCTGQAADYRVPDHVTSLQVTARGAGGEDADNGGAGKGAVVRATVAVTPGETLRVAAACSSGYGLHNGGEGGGDGGSPGVQSSGGGGGGSSGVYRRGDFTSLVEAAGGGGGGGKGSTAGQHGGGGGNGGSTGDHNGGDGGGGDGCCFDQGDLGKGGGKGGGSGHAPSDTSGRGGDGGNGSRYGAGGGGGGGGCTNGGGYGGGASSDDGGAGGGGGGGKSCTTSANADYSVADSVTGGQVTIATNGIQLVVTPDTSSFRSPPAVGDTISYGLAATNQGSNALTNVTITPPAGSTLPGSAPCSDTLGSGEVLRCTATYRITAADIDAGVVTRTSNSSGTSPVPDSVTVSAAQQTASVPIARDPGVAVEFAAPPSVNEDKVTYDLKVTNTGNTSLTNVVPTLTAGGTAQTLTCSIAKLAAGAYTNCYHVYTVRPADLERGSVAAQADVSATSPIGPEGFDPPAQATTPLKQTSKIAVKLTPGLPADSNGSGRTDAGDRIAYTAELTNTGNVTITEAKLGLPGVSECSPTEAETLAPAAKLTCTGFHQITQRDMDAGSVVTTLTGTAVGKNDETLSQTTSSTTTLDGEQTLFDMITQHTVVDTTNNRKTDAGDAVEYRFSVTNGGTTTVEGVKITAKLTAPASPQPVLDCIPADGVLKPGKTLTCTAQYTITAADVVKGTITSTAAATATSDGTTLTSPESVDVTPLDQNLQIDGKASLSNRVDMNSNGATDAGDLLDFEVLLTNVGTVPVESVTVAAGMNGATTGLPVTCTPGQPATLAVQGTMKCAAHHTVTAGDVKAGIAKFTANASGVAGGNPVQAPQMTVEVATQPTPPAPTTTTTTAPGGTTSGVVSVTNSLGQVVAVTNGGTPPAGTLPVTGSSVRGLLVLAGLLVAVGGVSLVLLRRPRRPKL